VQALYATGARRFVVANLPPLGCLPELRPLSGNGSCVTALNDLAAEHNLVLAANLQNLTAQLPGSMFVTVDVFGLLGKAVAEPRLLGKSPGGLSFFDRGRSETFCLREMGELDRWRQENQAASSSLGLQVFSEPYP
jgi:hypothetical protein